MSLGERLKACRKKAGLSQEQLAEKLCVSRQAVTKWETDRGTPDVENLKRIAALFEISMDSLLDDAETLPGTGIKERIDLMQYEKKKPCRSRYDAAVRSKYPGAKVIYPLIRRKKLSMIENIVDFIVLPGTLQAADSLNDTSAWYLVEQENRQLLVNVTKEFIESRELNCKFTERKQVIGSNLFIKAAYTL